MKQSSLFKIGNSQVAIQVNADVLLALKPMWNHSKISELRKVQSKIEIVCVYLQRFEVNSDYFDPILTVIITKKLPSMFCLKVLINMPEEECEISKLLHEISKELPSRERYDILNCGKSN